MQQQWPWRAAATTNTGPRSTPPPHTVKLPDKCYKNFIAIYVKGVMDAPECMACPGTFIKPAQAVAKAVKVKPACSG